MVDKLLDDAAQVDSDKYDEILSSTIEKEREESDNSKEIERRAQINDFIIQWSKNPDIYYTELGDNLGMHSQKVTDFVNEFISVMRTSSENNTFPKSVLEYFNHPSVPQTRRITTLMLQNLAPAIDVHLSNIEKPNNSEIINDNVAQQSQNQNQPPVIPMMPNPPQTGFKQIPDMLDPDDLGDEGLVANNHTITQLISFGLKKFTPESLQQRRYIMDLIRSNKLFYATNRNALRDLLSSVIKHQPTVNAFLDWLEGVAPIYLTPGEPFYRLMSNNMDPNNPQQMGGMPPMIQQLMGNLPPAQAQMLMQNLFANNKSAAQQQQAEEDLAMDRQVQRLYKVMTIKMLSSAMDPNTNQQNNPMMNMQQQYMMQGYRPSEVIQPDGTRRIEWLPPFAQGGGGNGGPFQDVQSIIGLVSSIISLTGAAGKGTDLNETLTKVFMEKMMADPVDQMLKLKQATEQLGLSRSGPSIDPIKQLELQTNLVKLGNEKEFGLRQLEIQERQMAREEAREAAHEQQSNENIAMLMKFVPGTIEKMAGPILQKFFGGSNKPEAVPPQPAMMGQPQDFSGTEFTPTQSESGGIFGNMNRNKLLKQGAVPLGGIINDNDYYVDPRNDPNAMSSIQEHGEMQKRIDLEREIENRVMHKINTSHLRNNMPPPTYAAEPQISKEQLMNLSNEELAQVGQMINQEREKYESSINNFNEVVQMRQQQQAAMNMPQQEQEQPVQEHPPVVDMEEYKQRFKIPEGTDLNDDGVISEEDYESSSSSESGGQGQQQQTQSQSQTEDDEVVDFASVDSGGPPVSQDSLLTDEDDL